MTEEERLNLSLYLNDFLGAMKIGNVVFELKESKEFRFLINKLLEENEKLKNQQKEFIKWLENEINDYKEVKEVTSDMRHVDYPVSYYIADYSLKEAKRILLEYKKIIMEEEKCLKKEKEDID